ncbi:MAG: glycosyltransferase [Candidatus Aenigmarchaeota archaeon]|nr:glycosyltransferase [Candidatus Aenigmarchaeota archaeon]
MKILQVTNFFKPSWESGGPARSCYEISKELVKRGHEVTVYTTDGFKYRLDVAKNKPVIVDGIKVYYFRNLSNYLSRNFVLPIPYYLPFVAGKEIKNFDVIHLHEYRTFLNIVVSYYARKYKIPYVLQSRGSIPRLSRREELKIIFDILWGYRLLDKTSKIIFSSKIELEKSKYKLKRENKFEIIPNSLNLYNFKKLPKKGEFRKKYSINKNEKIILYVGRIHKIKGLDLLISVFSSLNKELKDIKLVIVGPDDGHLNSLKNLAKTLKIENKILFTDPLFGKDKLTAYVDADIFVLPSKYESFGNVALESLACGTPIIITKGCGLSEYIDRKVGYIIDYNKQQLLETLYDSLTKDKKIKIMGKNAKKFVEKFSWTEIVEKIKKVYIKVLNTSNIR